MVTKRSTKTVKASRKVNTLKAKSLSSKKAKSVKGGAVDAFIWFDAQKPQADWSGPGDETLKGKI